jgi:hypothetical protein
MIVCQKFEVCVLAQFQLTGHEVSVTVHSAFCRSR